MTGARAFIRLALCVTTATTLVVAVSPSAVAAAKSPADPGAVVDSPLATTQYRLRFVFAGGTAATSTTATVAVRPQISLASSSFTLRKGRTYRLSGRVFPVEIGRKVTVWTNRGGAWRPVSGGGTYTLVHGTSFVTRLFGTPKRENYKLQVRLAGNASYRAARSVVVKATIR